jgi:hypothetical protein
MGPLSRPDLPEKIAAPYFAKVGLNPEAAKVTEAVSALLLIATGKRTSCDFPKSAAKRHVR